MKSKVTARDNSLFQRNVQAAFNEVDNIPILNGCLIENVSLTTTATKISHKLSRPYRGFIVVRKNANVDVWETTDSVDNSLFLPLDASGTVTVSLWVF
jgi:hypothetical protein